ncbi:MAG: hypothetical protein JKY37_30260, partial [Nannocystaceae bacterium]|nr:hypothetical protein [Nannocystaceae bacterium]
MQRLMLLVALSIPVGCDRGADADPDHNTDEASLRLSIGAAVQDNLAGVKDGQAALATAVAKLDEKLSTQLATLDALDSKIDALASKL